MRTQRLKLSFASAAGILLVSATAALAGKPVKGATYTGVTTHEKDTVTLKVAPNGKSVSVSVPTLPLYCQGGGPPEVQVTQPARISSSGAFSGKITYKFHGKVSFKASFSGKFAAAKATGTLHSEYKTAACSGSTSFTAKAG